jgi:hypothetical protein
MPPIVHHLSALMLCPGKPFLSDTTLIAVVENQIKYAGYIKRQLEEIEKYRKNENTSLPEKMDYSVIKALSAEVIQKLNDHQPETIGQASRLQGLIPASISILLVYLKTYSFIILTTMPGKPAPEPTSSKGDLSINGIMDKLSNKCFLTPISIVRIALRL